MKKTVVSDPLSVVSRMIALADLRVAEWNARKTMDLAALAELAESIRLHGVQAPLIVRITEPAGPPYEIIAGHRRFKAAAILKLAQLPCLVHEMEDALAREIALVDNLQREGLPPLEEAAGFAQLMAEPGADLESVAAKLGKSASYVGRRLKLLDAIAPVREAVKAGAIEVGHALELSRLDARLQEELLEFLDVGYRAPKGEVAEDEDEDGMSSSPVQAGVCQYCDCDEGSPCELEEGAAACSWADATKTVCTNPHCLTRWRADGGQEGSSWRKTDRGVGHLKKEIARRALEDLSAAPFPLDSAALGAVACSECPKRSVNQALLFNDLAGSDVCTDSPCFERKCRAFVQIEIDAAATDKRKLLKLSAGWTNDKGVLVDYNVRVLESADECVSGEDAIYVSGSKLGTRVTICRDTNCKKHRGSRPSYGGGSSSSAATPAEKEKHKADRKKILDKVKAETAYRKSLAVAIAAAPVLGTELPSLIVDVCVAVISRTNSLYAAKLAAALGWNEKLLRHGNAKLLREKLAGLQAGQQLITALLCEESHELSVQEYSNWKADGLEKLARRVGVDPARVRAGTASKPEQKPDAKPVKSAQSKPATKKTPVLSAAARKRIAEVQRKRWAVAAKKAPAKKAAKAAKKKGGR